MACCICRRVWDDMPVLHDHLKHSSPNKQAFLNAHISVVPKEQGVYRLDFTLSSALATKYCVGTLLLRQVYQSQTLINTPQSRRLNSQEVLNLARTWIATCIGPDHKHCPNGDFGNRIDFQGRNEVKVASAVPPDSDDVPKPLSRAKTFIEPNPPSYPSRLIALGSADDPTVKLIVTRNAAYQTGQILESPRGQYVTLSHCWGKIANPFCLNATNLDVFRDTGIPLNELPQTFRDAIHFARRLSSNVKYIWIDSLCIIQGDEKDWLHESTHMFEVYRNSYCNLSATAAEDSTGGLYAEREPQHLWGGDVDLNTEDMLRENVGSKRKRDSQSHETLIQRCKIVDPSFWDRKVDTAPANTRAWVLQERLLAPRVLHFCEDQIAWECRELEASESASTGIDNFELKSGVVRERVRLKSLVAQEYGPEKPSDEKAQMRYQAHENWKRITEKYSMTSLTKPEDKLIALAGIAQQMSTEIGASYVAGMWDNQYLASQLLWRVETQYKNGRFLYPSRRPKKYRAPSFSWAAIDAPQGIRCGETREDGQLLIKVTEVDVRPQPKPNSRFGLVAEGGFIKLKCQKAEIAIERKSRRTTDGDQDDVYTWTLIGDREGDDANLHPNVYLDSPEDDFEEIRGWHSSMWLVPSYKNSGGDLIGLLLQRMKNNDKYRRVGLSVIPRYVGARNTFMNENGEFEKVKRRIITIA